MNAKLCAGCGLKIPTWRSKLAKFCNSKCREKHASLTRNIGGSAVDKGRDDRLTQCPATTDTDWQLFTAG
jgi:hypothetical protein